MTFLNISGDRGSVELEERIHRNRSPDRRHGKAIQTSHGARHILPLLNLQLSLFFNFCYSVLQEIALLRKGVGSVNFFMLLSYIYAAGTMV